MGSVTIPTAVVYAGLAVSAAAGAYSAYSEHEAGVSASNEAKQKARMTADQATQTQITQRQNLLKALASQNAAAGATGAGPSTAVTGRQISQNQNDLLTSRAGASAQIGLYNDQAANAITTGNAKAAVSLLDTAKDTYNGLPG
jgi:hypothetical protein